MRHFLKQNIVNHDEETTKIVMHYSLYILFTVFSLNNWTLNIW